MVRITPSDLPKVQEPKATVTRRVEPTTGDHSEGDLLQKDPAKTSRLAEVIQIFRRKQKEPRKKSHALKRYMESQEHFEVGDPLGFRIDRKV